jgi:hypothetical protein
MKNNVVAKHANKFNKATIFKDKKKTLKCGDGKYEEK